MASSWFAVVVGDSVLSRLLDEWCPVVVHYHSNVEANCFYGKPAKKKKRKVLFKAGIIFCKPKAKGVRWSLDIKQEQWCTVKKCFFPIMTVFSFCSFFSL